MTPKDASLQAFLARLELDDRGWIVVDHWPADHAAVGIAAKGDPRRLVYVSVFDNAEGFYDYECEEPRGPSPDDYNTTAAGQHVTFDILLSILIRHLSR
jgi:hypothetical protein